MAEFPHQWAWKVTLRPQQKEAPMNSVGNTPPCSTSLMLCPFMVAAHLMHLLWPDNTPTQHYAHLTEEDVPGIQRAFFGCIHHLQQAYPHALTQTSPPPPCN